MEMAVLLLSKIHKVNFMQVGRTVLITVSLFLITLLLAPLYDMIQLHKYKVG